MCITSCIPTEALTHITVHVYICAMDGLHMKKKNLNFDRQVSNLASCLVVQIEAAAGPHIRPM